MLDGLPSPLLRRGLVEALAHLRDERRQPVLALQLVVPRELRWRAVELEERGIEAKGLAHPLHQLTPLGQPERRREAGAEKRNELPPLVRLPQLGCGLFDGQDRHPGAPFVAALTRAQRRPAPPEPRAGRPPIAWRLCRPWHPCSRRATEGAPRTTRTPRQSSAGGDHATGMCRAIGRAHQKEP